MTNHQLTLGSLFDGIGGFPFAGEIAGIKPVWAAEIEPLCVAVTKRHFPDMLHFGDVTKLNGADLPPVDIITFGSPCQDVSVAGPRKGLKHKDKGDGETTRSGLFFDAVRIIYEMREATNGLYPTFIVWENVPGAFTSHSGRDFRTVLEEIAQTDIPMPRSGKWANAGVVRSERIHAAWRVLDAVITGSCWANNYYNNSTRDMKKNIQPQKADALSLIKLLKFYSYDYDMDLNQTTDNSEPKQSHIDFGLVAEESPQEIKSEDGKAINLYEFISLTAKSVQELSEKVEKQAQEITRLKAEISALKQ